MRFWRYAALTALILALAGCASTRDPTQGWSPERIYNEAHQALTGGDYTKAINYFQTLEGRYPFGRYAQQAQLEIAYAYYRNSEPKSAIAAAQRFINEHPRSPHVDYAYYLMGLSDFQSTSGIVAFFRPNSAYEVDVTPLRKSFLAFKTLLEKFPHSRYAPDARKRMVYLRNQLAAHELYVARYYMRRGAYVAVVNRCKDVLTTYAGSSHTLRALNMMAEAYDKLGMNELAKQTREVIKLNQPGKANGKTKG
ncbi:outer membrane protein assembly factor BamD [Acidihalobacter prosperus]